MKTISNLNDFTAQISKSSLTVVDFYADWVHIINSKCGPCKAVAPKYESLSAKYPSVTFVKINIDDAQVFFY